MNQIESAIERGERISEEQALALLRSAELFAVGKLAHRVREGLYGKVTTYIVNRHINHTNVCIYRCSFCAFRRSASDEDAYTLSVDDYLRAAEGAEAYSEIHTVGGNNKELRLEYYEELLRAFKRRYPQVHAKFLTAVEIFDIARWDKIPVETVLRRLIDAGLDSLPGGGAEIFAPRVRKTICRGKADAEQWLEVHRTAHRLGLKSTATMLYGTVETDEEIIDHMSRLRKLQDETGGFTTFIPLAFQPENNAVKSGPTSGVKDLKVIAVARLFLDNIPHIKAYWIMLGLKTAQVALHFGADDIDGTVVREFISHEAGAPTPEGVSEEELRRLISEAGFIPVRRDSLYNEIPVGSCRT